MSALTTALGGNSGPDMLRSSSSPRDPQAVIRGHSLVLPIALSHCPRDGNLVSSLHCMNDPQPEGHMASHIGRRKFLATLLGGAAAAWPLEAQAQQPAMPVVGLLHPTSLDLLAERMRGLRQGLKDI